MLRANTEHINKVLNMLEIYIKGSRMTLAKVNMHFGFCSPGFTCSKLTVETLEKGMKYVQS